MNASARCYQIDRSQYIYEVTGALLDALDGHPAKAKAAANIARAPLATAKHWTDRTSAPSDIYQARLRSSLPEYDAKMRALEGLRDNHDPDFPNRLDEAFQAALRDPKAGAMLLALYDTFFKHHNEEKAA